MKSCLNATTLTSRISFAEFVRLAGQAGFAGVEVRLRPVAEMVREVGVDGVRSFFASAGVVPAHCGLSASLTRPEEDFRAGLALVPAECELAHALGIPTAMLVVPFRRDQGGQSATGVVERVREVAAIAAEHAIGITLEFIGLHQPPELRPETPTTLGQTLDFIERIDRSNVGVLIDSYHFYVGGSQLSDLDRIPKGMPLFIHLNDAPAGPVETLSDPMRVLPGEGVIDLVAWLAEIRRATGYDGFVSLELFNEEIRQLEPTIAVERCAHAVNRVLGALAADGGLQKP